MVYPVTKLPVVVEIAPGANPSGDPGDWEWTDATSYTSLADGDTITIEEGRGNWGDHVDAGKCSLVFKNQTGDFSEHNPLGQWYGQLGKNTPLRVRLKRGEDAFGRTESSGWGSADSGQAWTTSGGSASDFSVSSGAGRHSHGTVNVLRRSVLDVDLLDTEQLADASTPALLTGAALVTGALARYQDPSNYYWLRTEFDHDSTDVILKITKRVDGTETQLAVLDPVPSLAYAVDTPLRTRAQVDGNNLRMKVWPAADPEPAGWDLETTDDSLTEPGATGIQSWLVSGNTNALPVVASFDNYALHVDLFGGFAPTWVPRWDQSGNIRIVPVTAYGVLYRLQPGQGKPPSRSPLRRTIAAANPVAYWPVEDGIAAGQVGSALSGHPPLTVSGTVTFQPVDDYTFNNVVTQRYGTSSLADLSSGGKLSAVVPASAGAATATAWTVHATGLVDPSTASGNVVVLEWATPGGTYVRWQLVVTTLSRTQVIGYGSAGTATTIIDYGSATTSFTTFAVSATQNGANIDVSLYVGEDTATASASIAGAVAGVASVASNTTSVTNTAEMPIGHIAVFAASSVPYGIALYLDDYGEVVRDAARSWRDEAATDRLARLVAEDGISITIPAVSTDGVVRMGWQPSGIPLDLYRQCEDADGGVLYERPFRLQYAPRESLYNQSPTLTLSAQGDLAEPPEPDDTDQRYRNRWEVKRTDGASAVAEADEIADGALVYDEFDELLLADDNGLADQAGWRLHLTSGKELRWPKLDLDLAAVPEDIDAWLNCRIGSRIQATSPPEDVAGQDIDVLLEGYTVTLGYKDWDISANCSPAKPWDVATADGDQRVASEGSTLAAELAEGATSMSLASTTANGVWTTDATDFPLDIRVGGERITLSAISGTTSPQTATITARGVNGVQRAWNAGTEVDVWEPAIVPL